MLTSRALPAALSLVLALQGASAIAGGGKVHSPQTCRCLSCGLHHHHRPPGPPRGPIVSSVAAPLMVGAPVAFTDNAMGALGSCVGHPRPGLAAMNPQTLGAMAQLIERLAERPPSGAAKTQRAGNAPPPPAEDDPLEDRVQSLEQGIRDLRDSLNEIKQLLSGIKVRG